MHITFLHNKSVAILESVPPHMCTRTHAHTPLQDILDKYANFKFE